VSRAKKTLAERFWPKVNKTETCWLWTASSHEFGYGVIGCPDRPGRTLRAHRVSYEFAHGPIPEGLQVLHKCDVPACVNPDHLFLGKDQDNVSDMIAKGRFGANGNGCGEGSPNSKLTWGEVCEIRSMAEAGKTHKSIADIYEVSRPTISNIVKSKTWKKRI
jgi:hypothetical protein